METTNNTQAQTWNNPSAQAGRLIAAYSDRAGLNDSYATICTLQSNSSLPNTPMWESLEAAKTHMLNLYNAKQAEIENLWGESASQDPEVIRLVEAAERESGR
jgi:hypothetical protein